MATAIQAGPIIAILVFLLLGWTHQVIGQSEHCNSTRVFVPPKITRQSPKDIYYKVNETVKITCEGTGIPTVRFTWKRQGIDFNPAGNDKRITQIPKKGTLVINHPEDKDEGMYQCFASNEFGSAVSVVFNLRMAKLDPFSNDQPQYHEVQLGSPLRISCQSPDSVPDANIYLVVEQKDSSFNVVDWNSTISMDYEDRIYFAHVTALNHQDGQPYRCIVENRMMRASAVGPAHYINPKGASEQMSEIRLVWPKSLYKQIGLVGTTAKLKCIFAGNPTPIVKWRRADGKPFSSRVNEAKSDGQELTISDLRLKDTGSYICEAQAEGSSSPVQSSFSLTVQSRPTWVEQPQDIEVGVGSSVILNCKADGVPKPKSIWYVNGKGLEEALRTDTRLKGGRFTVTDTGLYFNSVTFSDTMTIQCNSSNIYGYVWGEATIKVLNQAPSKLSTAEQIMLTVAERSTFELPCPVTVKPDRVSWFKNGVQISGGRHVIKESGALFVDQSVLSDAGDYVCEATNRCGSASVDSGVVIIRRKTVIEQKPMDLEVKSGNYAKFTCSGTTDPEEINNLRIIWWKDYKEIELGSRFYTNPQDNSLILSGAEVRDTGTFTCVLTNGLDNDTASARLEVTDIPDRPYSINITTQCHANQTVDIIWVPGNFNNAPIQRYIIEYVTNVDPENWVFATSVMQTKAKASVKLSPGLSYFFRVTAVNKVGSSPSSPRTTTECKTSEDKPLQNPRNVRTIGNVPGKIHIEWTPVPPRFQGGDNFYYKLEVRRVGYPDQIYHFEEILDWRTSFVEIADGGSDYEAYEIKLQSANILKDAIEQVKTYIGHSAESLPVISPTNLEAVQVTVDSVVLQWTFPRGEINSIATNIKGEFQGFQIQMWEENKRDTTIRQWNLQPADFQGQTGDLFNTSIRHMMPMSVVEANVAVANTYFIGKPSLDIRFQTQSGVPGPVSYMEEEVIGDNHITIRWQRPLDDRAGDIIGFDIGYQEVRRGMELGEMQEKQPQIDDPYTSDAMVDGLLPLTKYRIHIWARSTLGRGESYFIERTTTAPGVLSVPRYSVTDIGTDHINITWWRDILRDSGSVVFVQYKQQDGAEWFSSTPDVTKDWMDIKFLEAGMTYQVRVVATNGIQKQVSIEEDVTTDGDAKAYDVVASLGWFLGILFSTILHICLIVLFCFCYRRGYRFNTQKKGVQTYRQGTEAYTDEDELGRKSEDLGPEPRGHVNNYYEERDSYEEGNPTYKDANYQDFADNDRQDDYRSDEKLPWNDDEYEDYKYDNRYDDEYEDYPAKPGASSSQGSNADRSRDRYDYDDDNHGDHKGNYDNRDRDAYDSRDRGQTRQPYDDYDDQYGDDGYGRRTASQDPRRYQDDNNDSDDNYSPYGQDKWRGVVDEVSHRMSVGEPREHRAQLADLPDSTFV